MDNAPVIDQPVSTSVTSIVGHVALDFMEDAIRNETVPLDIEPVHTFTPGLYTRSFTMPPGSVWISKIHKMRHPFVVLRGKCRVWDEAHGWQEIQAPYFGITEPGTKRLLAILEETQWITFHATELTNLVEIESALIEPRSDEQKLLDLFQLKQLVKQQQEELACLGD